MTNRSVPDVSGVALDGTDGLVWHGQRTAFTQIPDWLLSHPSVGAESLRTWLAIASYAGKTMTAFPGVRALQAATGKGRSSIFRHLDELESAGALYRRPQYRADGGRTSTLYVLAWDSPLDAEKSQVTPPSHGRDGVPRPIRGTSSRLTDGTPRTRPKKEPKPPTPTQHSGEPPTDRPQGGDPPATPPSVPDAPTRPSRAAGTNPRAVAQRSAESAARSQVLDNARNFGARCARYDPTATAAVLITRLVEERRRDPRVGWDDERIAAAVAGFNEVNAGLTSVTSPS